MVKSLPGLEAEPHLAKANFVITFITQLQPQKGLV